jgi:hypothetical protein
MLGRDRCILDLTAYGRRGTAGPWPLALFARLFKQRRWPTDGAARGDTRAQVAGSCWS